MLKELLIFLVVSMCMMTYPYSYHIKKIKEAYSLIKDFLSNSIKKSSEVEVQESKPLSEVSLFQSKVCTFPSHTKCG